MTVSLTLWAMTVGGIIALLLLDFIFISRKPHEVKFREALTWSIFYVAVAVAFGVALFIWQGADYGTQYFTAYIVEKSLSVDNLFIFVLILTQFAVPLNLHQRVLLIGIILALVMRAVFIAIGAAALEMFSFTFVIFGLFLIWTGVQLARHRNDDPDPSGNVIVRFVRKRIPFSDEYQGTKLFTRIQGRRVATPLLVVMIAIGLTDLLFALDSIPATFGVTQVPYLVFCANAFALLGLRALYFLVKGLLDRLVYLAVGLSIILVFIGLKLILTFAHEMNTDIPKIPTEASLVFIVVVLGTVGVASWLKVRRDPEARAHAAMVVGPDAQRDEDHQRRASQSES
jgi:tellurite resistance protein TerC